MDGRCVVALWYTLAMYLLDGAGCEFEYVWIRVCAVVVWVGMGEIARARAVFVRVCEYMCVSLTLSL
jgi:hypothetical protein